VIDCVSNRSCVAPNGADQSNHRFDQSVFSIVLAKMHIRCHNNWKFNGYLDEDRLHEVRHAFHYAPCAFSRRNLQADRWDVDNGFGRCAGAQSRSPRRRCSRFVEQGTTSCFLAALRPRPGFLSFCVCVWPTNYETRHITPHCADVCAAIQLETDASKRSTGAFCSESSIYLTTTICPVPAPTDTQRASLTPRCSMGTGVPVG
jgi:hypothetical protein